MAEEIRPGVFFDIPLGLPRGPHGMRREQVERAQEQRLLVAFTELVADRGYAKLRITDLTKRAGVSNNTFYSLYASKEDCACAAYERYANVIARMAISAGLYTSKTWREFIQASVEGYVGALTADSVVARAFQTEGGALGAKARAAQKAAALLFAEERLNAQERLRRTDPLLKRRPLSTHLAAILGMRELMGDALEASNEPDFQSMVPELVDWVVTAWYDEKPDGRPGS